jgi:hypothetical protein
MAAVNAEGRRRDESMRKSTTTKVTAGETVESPACGQPVRDSGFYRREIREDFGPATLLEEILTE